MEVKLIKILKQVPSFFLITIGATLAAASLEIFLIPNSIIDGGLTGISIILNKLFSIPVSILIILLNIPFFILAYKNMGKRFVVKAVYAIVTFTILLEVFGTVEEVTDDILLATVYGGLLLGVGVGLVIRGGACLDGTEIVAIVIGKKSSLSVGQVVFFFNIFIYGTAIFVFGPDRALYSLLMYFVTYKLIDMVSDEFNQAKAAIIITDRQEQISDAIFKELGRTVTIWEGEGKVSKSSKSILYTVITRLEIPRLKEIVENADTSSFVAVSEVSDIIGNHIKKIPKSENKKEEKNEKQNN